MTKQERLEYIKSKLGAKVIVTDAVIPPNKRDITEEMNLMDSFQEHLADKKRTKNHLTSDE